MQNGFDKILLDFKSIPRCKRIKTFMEISGYQNFENVCNNILKFYLNPTNEHGLNDLVLNSLLHLINKDFQFDLNTEQIVVYREFKTLNGNRLDLLILTEKYAIGIENRIFRHLNNDFTDYNYTVKSLCYNSRKPINLVLSLTKLTCNEDLEKISENDFLNVTYEQFFKNIKQNIARYYNNLNLSYINHLTDFIKSIENLTPNTMENKALWTFFKNNSATIQELLDSFNDYKITLYHKIYQLIEALPKEEFTPTVEKQWVYNGCCLVHDYTINSKYKIAVDTIIDISGWEIQLFGRDSQSTDFIYNVMCKVNGFLPHPIESYEKGERLIYQKFDTDTAISDIAKQLVGLLSKIENYKK
jgi:hypothetical protein